MLILVFDTASLEQITVVVAIAAREREREKSTNLVIQGFVDA